MKIIYFQKNLLFFTYYYIFTIYEYQLLFPACDSEGTIYRFIKLPRNKTVFPRFIRMIKDKNAYAVYNGKKRVKSAESHVQRLNLK